MQDPQTGITFVRIRAGEFLMGSEQISSDEKPVHQVTITHDFLLAKYPVTNAQYRKFLEASGGKAEEPRYWDDRRFNQPEQPVVGVSWEDARAFCQWAEFRLPTEAEWEYACRAGTTTQFSFGDDARLLADFGWYDNNSNDQTQPVGAKKPNPWGLHDMHGNVWEWCADWYGGYTDDAAVDPVGPAQADVRVIRGGSWWDPAVHCRSAFRIRHEPAVRSSSLGFRVAAVPPGKKNSQSAEPGAEAAADRAQREERA